MPAPDYKDDLAFPPTEQLSMPRCDIKELKEKLDIAVKGLKGAAAWLTCMEDFSRFNDGKCNEQMALEIINKTLEKLK